MSLSFNMFLYTQDGSPITLSVDGNFGLVRKSSAGQSFNKHEGPGSFLFIDNEDVDALADAEKMIEQV